MTVDGFMTAQPPPLGGTVGNLAKIEHGYPLAALAIGVEPSLEDKRFVCAHCGSSMTRGYLVWHMNAKFVAFTLLGARELITGDDLDTKRLRGRAMCCPGVSRKRYPTRSAGASTTSTRVILMTSSSILLSTKIEIGRFSRLFYRFMYSTSHVALSPSSLYCNERFGSANFIQKTSIPERSSR
jgi:hypothetical protein